MKDLYPTHNANLHQTLPEQGSIVNSIDTCSPCSVRLGESLADKIQDLKTDKLFVKISNLIFGYLLAPRQLEFYCLMCFFTFAYPNCKLPILTIQALIFKHTKIIWNKDTINKYLNNLIELDLISRNQKYYTVTVLNKLLDTSNLCNSRPFCPPSCQEGLGGVNRINQPKSNYTIFHITIYNRITKVGSAGLEFYMASKFYNKHRPNKVCKELNICSKTYYSYLEDIVSSKIVNKIKLSFDNYHYTHDYRLLLWSNCVDKMNNKYQLQGAKWQKTNELKQLNTTNNSRKWYASDMLLVMKKYNINYIKAFDNYKPEDAYDIVQELELQYSKWNKSLNAKLIVKAILNNYNWIQIVDKRHTIIKQGLASMKTVGNKLMDNLFKVDYS